VYRLDEAMLAVRLGNVMRPSAGNGKRVGSPEGVRPTPSN